MAAPMGNLLPDWVHAMNHQGRMFQAASTSSGATYNTILVAPAAGWDVHAFISLYTSAATTYRVWEDVANIVSSGSALVPVCKNRCVPEKRAATATCRSAVTLNSSGATALTPVMFVGAGTGAQAAGGVAEQRDELILEGGKKYVIWMNNTSANKNIIVDFYETRSVN